MICSRPTLQCSEGDILLEIVWWLEERRDVEVRWFIPTRVLGLLKACVRFHHMDVREFLETIRHRGMFSDSVLLDFISETR